MVPRRGVEQMFLRQGSESRGMRCLVRKDRAHPWSNQTFAQSALSLPISVGIQQMYTDLVTSCKRRRGSRDPSYRHTPVAPSKAPSLHDSLLPASLC